MDSLTNEKLGKKFKNQFELVAYAIRLAENMIRTGRGPRVKTDVQNLAMQILEEIYGGYDQFDEILPNTEKVSETIKGNISEFKDFKEEAKAEKKKVRKIL